MSEKDNIKSEINFEINKVIKKLVDNIDLWGHFNKTKMNMEIDLRAINNQLQSLADENIKLNNELIRLKNLYESLENGGKENE